MQVIDSHTEGEPTRVVVSGGPELGTGSLQERLARFRDQFDHYRQFAIDEPRAFDAVVGALLCEPTDPSCATGVIFFNNTGYLGMCGHGTIGLAVTLHHMGRIELGTHQFETPVGIVSVNLESANRATIQNVPSYRLKKGVTVSVDGVGDLVGDIAWGGNWFFLIDHSPVAIEMANVGKLVDLSKSIRQALSDQGHTGTDGAYIDHIELSDGHSMSALPNSRNFVLCPGGVYDRSPCGTGTSAKLACLAEDGTLSPGQKWIQESITGGRFEACYEQGNTVEGFSTIVPSITGSAYITGETTLVGQAGDPFSCSIVTQTGRQS